MFLGLTKNIEKHVYRIYQVQVGPHTSSQGKKNEEHGVCLGIVVICIKSYGIYFCMMYFVLYISAEGAKPGWRAHQAVTTHI